MKISSKRLAALKSRARGGVKTAAGGIKGSAVQVLAGALTCYANQKLAENSAFYQSQWWIGPVAIGALGHILKKRAKLAPAGHAMLGAAGYALAQNYAISRTAAASNAPADAGAMYSPELGAMYYPGAAQLSPGASTSPTSGTSSYSSVDAAMSL